MVITYTLITSINMSFAGTGDQYRMSLKYTVLEKNNTI